MDDYLEMTSTLALELFDRHGRLKKEYISYEVRKGSGTWGHEFDKGDIVVFESIEVKKEYRGRKASTELVDHIWKQAKSRYDRKLFAFACATHIDDEDERRESRDGTMSSAQLKRRFEEGQVRSEAFLRSLGVRRVGHTQWFCIASDPDRPCYKPAASDDYNPGVIGQRRRARYGYSNVS